MKKKSAKFFKTITTFIFIALAMSTLFVSAMATSIKKSENTQKIASAEGLIQVDAELTNPTATYNGRTIPAVFNFYEAGTRTPVTIGAAHISITYTAGGAQAVPKNAGTYTAKVYINAQSGKQIVGGSYETQLIIEKKEIKIVDSGIKIEDKVYNGAKIATVKAGSYTYEGILSEDKAFVLVGAEAMFDNGNAGQNKPVTVGYSLGGVGQSTVYTNYKLQKPSTMTSGNISKKKLVLDETKVNFDNIISANKNKAYDGTKVYPSLPELALKNPVVGDISKIYLVIAYPQKDVGTNLQLRLSFIDNNEGKPYNGDNYELPALPTQTYFGEITKKEITVDKSKIVVTTEKVYDKSTAAHTAVLAGAFIGIVGGEIITPIVTADYEGMNVKDNNNISVYFSLNSQDAKNYFFKPESNYSVIGKITKRIIVIDGLSIEKIKQFDNTAVGRVLSKGTIQNLCEGDVVVYNVTVTFDRVTISNQCNITVKFSYANDPNYALPSNITYTDGKIIRRVLEFDLPNLVRDKTYDGNVNVKLVGTVQLLNLVVGFEGVTLTLNAAYENKIVGYDKTINVTNFSISGANMAYYDIPATKSYYGSISKKKITTANAIDVAKIKEFDGSDTATAAIQDGGVLTFTGIVIGDIVNGTVRAKYDSNVVGIRKTITIVYTLSGNDAENYEVDAVTNINGGEITPKKITVTIENTVHSFGNVGDAKIIFGNVSAELIKDYPIGYEVGYILNGIYSSTKPENVGIYEILIRITASNYTTTDGTGDTRAAFTIDPITPILTAKDYSVDYTHGEMDVELLKDANKGASNISGVSMKFLFFTDKSCVIALVGIPTDAGVYGYKIFCDKTDNYNESTSNGAMITIRKLNATINFLNTTQKVDKINGNRVEVVTNPIGIDFTVQYKINDVWTDVPPRESGKFQVKVIINDINYEFENPTTELTVNEASIQFEIIPKLGQITKESATRYSAIFSEGARYEFTIDCAEATPDDFSFSYETTAGAILTQMPTNSGNYIIKAKYTGTDRDGEKEIFFTIRQQDISSIIIIDKDSLNQFYDGKVKNIIATALVSGQKLAFDYLYTKSGNSVKNITDSGVYVAKAVINDKNYRGSKEDTFTINKSKRQITPINSTTPFKYSGVRFDPKVVFSVTDNGVSVGDFSDISILYEFQTELGEPIFSAPINSGKYKVRAKFADRNNYQNDVDYPVDFVSFSIVQTDVSVIWLTTETYEGELVILSTYDQNNRFDLKASDITFKNSDGQEMNLFSAVSIKYCLFDSPADEVAPVSVGKYIIKIIIAETENYTAKIFTKTLIILQRTIENPQDVIAYNPEDNKYNWNDGLEHNLIIKTFPINLAYTVKYYKSNDTERENPIDEVGRQTPDNYIAVVTITDSNYSGTFEYSVIVAKKQVTIDVTDRVALYGSPTDVSVLLMTDDGEIITNLTIMKEYFHSDGTAITETINGLPKFAGDYIVRVNIVDNFHEGFIEADYRVEKAQLFITFNKYSMIYNRQSPNEKNITVICEGFVYEDTVEKLNVKPSSLYSMKTIINAGVYTVKAQDGESDNYKFICSDGLIIIEKAKLGLVLNDGLEMEEGSIFDLTSRDNYTISGMLVGDSNAFNIFPTIKIFNNRDEDVTNQLRTLRADTYTAKLVGGTSTNYEIINSNSEVGKPFIIFSNTITSENGQTVIKKGKFAPGAVVFFDSLSSGNSLYRSTRKLTGKEFFGSKVLMTFELKVLNGATVVNSATGEVEITFAKPNIDFAKNPIMFINVAGKLTKAVFILNDNNTVTVTLPSANCAITFIEIVNYNWLIYLIIGGVLLIAAIIITIKRLKFVKALPDEVEQKGEALEVAPEQTEEESMAMEADEFNELIKKAETGELEELPPPEPKKPTIKLEPKKAFEPGKKKDTVADRILDMTVEKLKKETLQNPTLEDDKEDEEKD